MAATDITQELPAVESMADIHATDPLNLYTHRRNTQSVSWTEGGKRISVPYRPRPADKWSPADLKRLMEDLQ